jgi:hypothetical protein
MDRQASPRSNGRTAVAAAAVVVLLALGAVCAWRLAIQRVNLVIVNQSGVDAVLTWQASLFGPEVTMPIDGCESESMDLGGGQAWRLEANGLDINANAIERAWLTRMVAFEIWLEPGGSSRIEGPSSVERPVTAPVPDRCP